MATILLVEDASDLAQVIVRELEGDLKAAYAFREQSTQLEELMQKKVVMERRISQMRLRLQRGDAGGARRDFEAALHEFARSNHGDLLDKINETGDYDDDIQAGLKAACDGFAEKGAY